MPDDDLCVALICFVFDSLTSPFHHPIEDPHALLVFPPWANSASDLDGKSGADCLSKPVQVLIMTQDSEVVTMYH